MALLRISDVEVLSGFKLRLKLTDGTVLDRDIQKLLTGPVFDPIRQDRAKFLQVRVEGGTLVWPNGADLCPDVLIWNGLSPENPSVTDTADSRPTNA